MPMTQFILPVINETPERKIYTKKKDLNLLATSGMKFILVALTDSYDIHVLKATVEDVTITIDEDEPLVIVQFKPIPPNVDRSLIDALTQSGWK